MNTIPHPVMEAVREREKQRQKNEEAAKHLGYILEAEARRSDCGACGNAVHQFQPQAWLGDGNGGRIEVERRFYNPDGSLHECADQLPLAPSTRKSPRD